MRRNHEAYYTHPEASMDDPEHWEQPGAYYDTAGLGEDGGESMTRAPARAPAEAKPWYQALVETVVPVAANVYQQRQLTQLNLQRSRAGQPLLTAADYAATYQPPTAQIQVGPDAQAKRLMLYAGGAVAVLVALRALKVI